MPDVCFEPPLSLSQSAKKRRQAQSQEHAGRESAEHLDRKQGDMDTIIYWTKVFEVGQASDEDMYIGGIATKCIEQVEDGAGRMVEYE